MIQCDSLGDVAPHRMTDEDGSVEPDGVHESDSVAGQIVDLVPGVRAIRPAEPSLREREGMDRAWQLVQHRLERPARVGPAVEEDDG